MNNFTRTLVIFLASFFAGVLASSQSYIPAQIHSTTKIQAEAWQIVLLANQARTRAGVAPLKWDAQLALAARQHCLRMAVEGPISHRYPGEPELSERAAQAGAHFSLIEENVAIARSPAEIHEAWMHSEHHRSNLLNPDVDGVGVAVVAGRNGLYAVADYERIVPVLTPNQVEASIAALVQPSGVAVLHDATAARAACSTDRGLPTSNSALRSRFVMRWQTADTSHLPQELKDKLASGDYRQAAVGSCPPQGDQGAFTAYRLAVLLY
jgi:hypothetical protein